MQEGQMEIERQGNKIGNTSQQNQNHKKNPKNPDMHILVRPLWVTYEIGAHMSLDYAFGYGSIALLFEAWRSDFKLNVMQYLFLLAK